STRSLTREASVHQLHGHRSFAHCGGAALDRAGTNIAGCKYARHAGLEQVVTARCGARQDEPVLVACDRVVEPLGTRPGPEEEEEKREWESFACLECDRVEKSVVTVQRADLA